MKISTSTHMDIYMIALIKVRRTCVGLMQAGAAFENEQLFFLYHTFHTKNLLKKAMDVKILNFLPSISRCSVLLAFALILY